MLWFSFVLVYPLFLGMVTVTHDNEIDKKENKIWTKDKIDHNINTQISVLDFHKKYDKVSWQNRLLYYKENNV